MTSKPPKKSRVLLITGASRGIGAAVAKLASLDGYAVAVNYNNSKTEAEKVVSAISQSGGNAILIKADVSNRQAVSRMFEMIDGELGPLSGLVNNAGVLHPQTRIEGITEDRLQNVFAVNVFGAIYCAQEAVKRMQPGSSIVNVSSVAARTGSPGEYIDYAASKGALDTFTIGLANEIAPLGIRVNAVRPGFIHTEIHAAGGEPNRIERLKPNIPLRRGGTPEEVANAILWLLSGEASYVTGAFLDIAGGK